MTSLPLATAETTGLPRSDRRGTAADLSFAFGITAVPMLSASPFWVVALSVMLACLGTASIKKSVVLAAYALPAAFSAPWPSHCAAAVVAWGLLYGRGTARQRRGPVRSRTTRWWSPGLWIAAGAAAGACVVGIDHARIFGGGFAFALRLPSPMVLALLVVVAAAFNACAEELLWRDVLERVVGIRSIGGRYLLQAITFGFAHVNGIPHGWIGVLASGGYSVLVYAIWRRWGLLGGIVVHVTTDLIIFWFVAEHAYFIWAG